MNQLLSQILTADSFDELVLQSTVPVLVFVQDDSGASRAVAPVFDALAEENVARLRAYRLEASSATALLRQYGVVRTPAFMLFKDGDVAERIIGPVSRQILQVMVSNHT